MKKSLIICLNLISFFGLSAAIEQDMTVAISAAEYGKMPFLISTVGEHDQDVRMLADSVAHDLSWTGQFDVAIEHTQTVPTKQQLSMTAGRGFPLMLFVQREPDGKSFVWRLYDTMQAHMIKGKRLVKRGYDVRVWAHEMSDILWPVLTGQDGFFSTKIAYCKEVKRGKKRPFKYLCISDYDGSNEVVKVSTMVVAPRWSANGLLFYSECTNINVRLMYLDDFGKSHIASNFDGLNMLPSFSQDGLISIYCASRGNGNSQLYYCAPGMFKQLTHNEGNNVSPSMTPDGKKVYFCSDFQHAKPSIYCMDINSGSITEIISSGYCPSYSAKINKLAYIKNVKGVMQLFVYDCLMGGSEQLTFDNNDKDECSWSACANYIAYSAGHGQKSRIGMLHIMSRQTHWITSEGEFCTYPALWYMHRIDSSITVPLV